MRTENLGPRGAGGVGKTQQLRIDGAEALDRVQRGGKESEHGAVCDLRFRTDAEDQHGQRVEYDDRDGEDARQQRLEHPCAVTADAHEVADERSGDRRDRERDRDLHERHLDVRPRLPGGHDPDEHPEDVDRIGQEQRADPLRHGDGIPKQGDADDEGNLNSLAQVIGSNRSRGAHAIRRPRLRTLPPWRGAPLHAAARTAGCEYR